MSWHGPKRSLTSNLITKVLGKVGTLLDVVTNLNLTMQSVSGHVYLRSITQQTNAIKSETLSGMQNQRRLCHPAGAHLLFYPPQR
jgi:hypothetical protein